MFAHGEPGAAQVGRAERLAAVEQHGRACGLIIEIGEELELDRRHAAVLVGAPSPDATIVGLELGLAQRLLETRRVDGAGGDLEVDLDVDVGRAGVDHARRGAQQIGHEAAEEDEFGSRSVVMDDADQGSFGRRPSGSGAGWIIGHRRPP